MHLMVGLGFNPRVPVDHNLLWWMVNAPQDACSATNGDAEMWMWKQVAGAYCLIAASSHPEAEAWACLPPGSDERRAAEARDDDGIIKARKWYDELLRPEDEGAGSNPDDIATRFLSWDTAQALIDKFEWLDTEEGRRLATRVWKDARQQPYGFISLR